MTINKAKDMTKSSWKKNSVPLEQVEDKPVLEEPDQECLFEEVMKLPLKYRTVINLFYYEDLPVKDIAGLMAISEANVRKRLSRGRKLLKNILER